jgi:hypothetical protein
MDKSRLYQRSDPHREPGNLHKHNFEVHLGSPGQVRIRTITATSVSKALNVAASLCRVNERVAEVHRDGKKIWDAIERMTP